VIVMARDFLRRIDGYNRWFSVYGYGSLARNDILTVNAPTGPGRVEEVVLLLGDISVPGPMNNIVTITIDGSAVLNNLAWRFFYTYDYASAFGPICSRAHGSMYAVYQRITKVDYESSFSFAITNAVSPNPCNTQAVLVGRCGR
jgi:hypothetical protein